MKSNISTSLVVNSVDLKNDAPLINDIIVLGATKTVEAKITGNTEALFIFNGK